MFRAIISPFRSRSRVCLQLTV